MLQKNLPPTIKEESLFNPLDEDFTVTYDIYENKQPETYVAKSKEISTFPTTIAQHIKKHLLSKLVEERELGYVTPELHQELLEEIEVQL